MHEKPTPSIKQHHQPKRADTGPAKAVIDAFNRSEDRELFPHLAAEIFPRFKKDDLKKLAEDIKQNGLRQPIVLHPNGSILDGWNRFEGCRLAGVKPRFMIWNGHLGEEIAFVVSQNLNRRHMTERQRSIAAAKIAQLKRGRPKQADLPIMTQREAAAALNVGERNVRKARKVLDQAPANVTNLVEQDKMSLTAAEAVADASPEDKAHIAALSDEEEVVTAAKRLAKEKDVPSRQADAGASLLKQLRRLIAQWDKASNETRASLTAWLHEEANVGALEALRAMMGGAQHST